jgi:plastocyanin domain-containing protein
MAEKTRCEECDRTFPSPEALSMHNEAKHNSPINEKKGLSKKSIMIIAIIAISLIGAFLFFNSYGKNINANLINQDNQESQTNQESKNPSDSNQEVQKITLSMKNYNYYPNTINVKSGIPVELTLDNTIKGCYRSFNIQGLGVNKRSLNPQDTIKFTPNKKGNFGFACGMGMGTGTIIVE